MISASGVALALLLVQQKPGTPASPPRDSWFGADKLKHFFVAAFTQSVAYSALQAARVRHDHALAGAWAVTATVSVAKELHDRRTTGLFSVRDLVWDAAGGGLATVLLARSQRSGATTEPEAARSEPEPSAHSAGTVRQGVIHQSPTVPPYGFPLLSPVLPGPIFRAPSAAAPTVRGARPIPPPSA